MQNLTDGEHGCQPILLSATETLARVAFGLSRLTSANVQSSREVQGIGETERMRNPPSEFDPLHRAHDRTIGMAKVPLEPSLPYEGTDAGILSIQENLRCVGLGIVQRQSLPHVLERATEVAKVKTCHRENSISLD